MTFSHWFEHYDHKGLWKFLPFVSQSGLFSVSTLFVNYLALKIEFFKQKYREVVVSHSPPCLVLMAPLRSVSITDVPHSPCSSGPQVQWWRCVHHWCFSVCGAWPPTCLGVLEERLCQCQWWVETGIFYKLDYVCRFVTLLSCWYKILALNCLMQCY